jgi:stearoyl-CoA desaturase (Delta-9 desaturase)
MLMSLLNFLQHGFAHASLTEKIVYTLVMTHITILAVTIFLHRCQAHRALELHPIVSHFFRFWLWITTGMITKEWASIHRKHHAFSDKPGDPHSPHVKGIKKVFFEGAELYKEEADNKETLEKYGSGTPNDWIEKNLYTKFSKYGIVIMLLTNVALFGVVGVAIWAVQMIWIPLWAAGVINGLGHFVGYRNFQNPDEARNLFPIGILIGGEELHNNHHTFGTSAKLSYKWYEFDIGWTWIKIFSYLGLAQIKKISPVLHQQKIPKIMPDYQTLETVILNRYNLMMGFAKSLKGECKKELAQIQSNFQEKISWKILKNLLTKDEDLLTPLEKSLMQKIADNSQRLKNIFAMRSDIGLLWKRSQLTKEELLVKLQNWCNNADLSGIKNLQVFANNLRASC